MQAFTVRWRSAQRHQEFVLTAAEGVGEAVSAALSACEGAAVWQAGTLWRCPGCGDCTLRTEEFLEGLRQARAWAAQEIEWRAMNGQTAADCEAALQWIDLALARVFACERDRVYLKDESGLCPYEGARYGIR